MVIAAVVLVNALIGFVQEGRAERALAAIRDLVQPQASVTRATAGADDPRPRPWCRATSCCSRPATGCRRTCG